MSDYIVSARKYRPTNFNSVVGQSALTTTLKNAITTGKLAHAYLFCGPRGVGKTTSARIFAKTINCLSPKDNGEACGTCESCVAFDEGRSYNIHELDAASNNSVDDIRELIDQVQIPPQVGKYKVFIIDEVHMLSQAAFNAFLKTLEEPPAHAIFILATTEKHKILPTILSRCQIYDFNRMEVGETVAHLKHVANSEGIAYEEAALHVIAQKADGGMRDALSIFDQVASFTAGNITYAQVIENLNILDYDYYFKLTDCLLATNIPETMLTLNEILSKGFEANHLMGGLAAHFRDLLVSRDSQTLPLLEVAESVRQRYQAQSLRCTPQFLYGALRLCNDCDINYRTSRNKRLLVELTLIQVAQLQQQDEAPVGGRRPTKQLLPIFSPAAAQGVAAGATKVAPPTSAPQTQRQVAAMNAVGATAHHTAPTTARTAATGAATTPPKNWQLNKLKTISITKPLVKENTAASTAQTNLQPGQTSVASETKAAAKELHYESFSIDALCHHIMRFANELPRERAAESGRLKNIAVETSRLKLAPFEADKPLRLEILVENDFAARTLQSIIAPFTFHLRAALHNDYIMPEFVVDTTKRIQKRAYSPREIFQEMQKKNPDFQLLSQKLRLELA